MTDREYELKIEALKIEIRILETDRYYTATHKRHSRSDIVNVRRMKARLTGIASELQALQGKNNA